MSWTEGDPGLFQAGTFKVEEPAGWKRVSLQFLFLSENNTHHVFLVLVFDERVFYFEQALFTQPYNPFQVSWYKCWVSCFVFTLLSGFLRSFLSSIRVCSDSFLQSLPAQEGRLVQEAHGHADTCCSTILACLPAVAERDV